MKRNPIRVVDLNFNRAARPSKEVAILREEGRIQYYHATKASLRRLARVCRYDHEGLTVPFADGWLWERKNE